MLKLSSSVCIEAPVEEVWALLSDLAAIHLWVEAITRSYCPAQSRGVGARRICELKQMKIEETILDWQEGRSFTYEGIGAPMLKRVRNTWSVAPQGSQTLVTSVAEAELKGGVLGRMIQPILRPLSWRSPTRDDDLEVARRTRERSDILEALVDEQLLDLRRRRGRAAVQRDTEANRCATQILARAGRGK